jgi:threonine synthase
MQAESCAVAQRSMADPSISYPLDPPLTSGCPETSTEDVQYPVEIAYDYGAVESSLVDQTFGPGLDRWAQLLPPLADGGLQAGGTPLLRMRELGEWAEVEGLLYIKDESRNPTWSQKDRLNRVTVDAARRLGHRGIVASSSGNHGASAAAHAARAGLDCVVFTSPDTPSSMLGFLDAYGAAVLRVPGWKARAELVDALAQEGFHPVTSRTRTHTGHPYGPEGYKTIAYEVYQQLGGAPGAVFVPTAHAELLYGVWKGFRELGELDVIAQTPRMIACEPGARAPLAKAQDGDETFQSVSAAQTRAHSIAATESTYRGHVTLQESGGTAVDVSDESIGAARERLAEQGVWQEFSGAAGLAGARALSASSEDVPGPVVVLATSSGFKDGATTEIPGVSPDLEAVRAVLDEEYGVTV